MNTQEVLRLIADQLDARQDPTDLWVTDVDGAMIYAESMADLLKWAWNGDLRLKTKTHMVHGVECPAPMSDEPCDGSIYYIIDISENAIASAYYWMTGKSLTVIKNGGAFHTYADALANAKARYPELFTSEDDE